jgi:amino acid adenylation domain-containing protein
MEPKVYSYQVAVAANQNVKERDYWLRKLSGTPVKTGFLYDLKKNGDKEPSVSSLKFSISKELFSKLTALSSNSDYSLHIVLVSVLTLLLNKYNNTNDLLVGSPIYKQEADIEFINTTLVLRNRLTAGMSFKELLLQVKQTVVEAAENQNYPIDVLPERLNIPITGEGNPFFDIALLLENIHDKKYIADSRYSMLFSFLRTGSSIETELEYNPGLYRVETVRRILRHFIYMLEKVVGNIDAHIADIEIMTGEDKEQILMDFNNTDIEYPRDKTVCELFEEQAAKSPGSIAVTGPTVLDRNTALKNDISLTFSELKGAAGRLAAILIGKGLQTGGIVAVMMIPSVEMIVSLWAVLKAGGAYLPIEPEYPQDRISYMMADSSAKMMLTARGLEKEVKKLKCTDVETVFIDDIGSSKGERRALPGDIAYVIYTSGSTGKPKGVLVRHNNLAANIFAFYAGFDIGPADTMIQLSAFTFDAFAEELYPVLLIGGKLVIPGLREYIDIQKLGDFMHRHKVSIVDCSPLLLNELNKLDMLTGVRIFISGGDVLKEEYIDRLAKTGQVYNTYGPTETTICVTYHKYEKREGSSIPIGKPIANYKVYITGENLRLVPAGVVGEICVAGPGVTGGYLNRPELTAEKFINLTSQPGDQQLTNVQLIYRTGDLGRWLPDGAVEFFGRKDNQVKIRGFRIETGEIETLLMKKPGIKEAAVTVRDGKDGDKYLCAYIVPEDTGAEVENGQEAADLRQYLSQGLPDFMIPAFFVRLEKMPLTSGGKIDRKVLPEPEVKASVEYVEPRNDVEKQVLKIWREILGLDRIGVLDDFFEIGGHSLKATVMISKIRQAFNVTLPLAEIFSSPTISHVASYISSSETDTGNKIEIDDNLVLLRKGTQPDNHLFFLHSGSGAVEFYSGLCNFLHPRINCWGIQADGLEDYIPQNLAAETIARKYIAKIEKVQPRGPYNIAGWCIGGTFAFEMVRRLEQMGQRAGFFAMIDSPAPEPEIAREVKTITFESELAGLLDGMKIEELRENLKTLPEKELKLLWRTVVDYFERNEDNKETLKKYIPNNLAAEIPNFKQQDINGLIYNLNMIKTYTRTRDIYLPLGKINTNVHYFDAAESIIDNKKNWNKYTYRPVKFHEVQGDHFSMLDMPYVEEMAKLFNGLMA